MAGHRCRLSRRKRAKGVALIDDIGSGPVGVDAALFVYFIEETSDTSR
jgi:hypothetical protein